MSKIKNGALDQHGAKPFEQQQFETAGVEGVKISTVAIFQNKLFDVVLVPSCLKCGVVMLRRTFLVLLKSDIFHSENN